MIRLFFWGGQSGSEVYIEQQKLKSDLLFEVFDKLISPEKNFVKIQNT